MRLIRYILLAATLWTASLTGALAQEDDKGFLTRTLQDVLSDAGRTVSIDGFRGALSSEASFDRLTIADEDGIWLTLEDVTLDWNRSALLRGRLEVESLTAGRLDLPRLPITPEDALPEAEAAPFSLPELPVSVQIDTFAIDRISLGAALFGEAAELTVSASARLNDAEGDVRLQAERIDGQRGEFTIEGNFERSDSLLDLVLRLSEGADGIAANLLDIPGKPSVDLSVAGSGPIDDFTADVEVSTDGEQRLAGEITLGAQTPRRPSDTPDRRIQADIGGDITTLLAPRYREFFGTDVRLVVDALVEGNGAIDVSEFALRAQAARLEGRVLLNAEKWPTLIDVTGEIANPDGTPLLLPVGGEGTTVQDVTLRVDYDAAQDDAIDADFQLTGLQMADVSVEETSLTLRGTLQSDLGRLGAFAGDVTFDAGGIALNDPALAEAVGNRLSGRMQLAYDEGQPVRISDLELAGTDVTLSGEASIEGIETGLRTELDAALTASDLSRFSALAGREIDGSAALGVAGTLVLLGGQFDLEVEGSTDDVAVGIPQADAVLDGRTALSLRAVRNETGTILRDVILRNAAIDLTGSAELRSDASEAEARFRLSDVSLVVPQYDGPVTVTATARQEPRGWVVDASTEGPYGAELTARGLVTGPDAAVDFTADIPEVGRFTDQVSGPLQAEGNLRNTSEGWRIVTTASGPYGATAQVEGLVAPRIEVDFDVSVPNLRPIVPQLNGPLQATGELRQTDDGYFIRTDANGPYGARASVEGMATGPDMRLDFDLNVPNVNPLVPGVSGPLSAQGQVRQTPQGIRLSTTASGPYSANARAEGIVTGPNADVRFSLDMPNIGVLVDRINGPLALEGRARREGAAWRVDTDAAGPAGTQAVISGTIGPDGRLNLDISGNAPLGLSRPFLAPRDLQGQARFDLRLDGPPALSSLSGRISTSDASFSAPNLRVTLTGIAGDIDISGNRAQVDLRGNAVNGGGLRVGGAITLTPALPADLRVALQDIVLIDPRLYRTSVSGDVRVAGPLTGGALISGQIVVGETIVNVPATGLTSIGDIPPITHIGATRPVLSTRRKAGLEAAGAGKDPAGGGGVGYGLDLAVSAPNRIFVRGRGLDAELGGSLRLTGTTNRVISAGRFDLLRGRLDILAKRFELREGSIQFQGDLVPFIRFVSATSTATGEVRVVVQGPANAPEVTFEATPDAPQDEVLAQLLFGRNLSDISAFQALQLANAVAVLAGRGGVGVIGNLRDSFGLDDLDITTTEDGSTAVRAGKYLSENVYTDITAASDGTGEVSLNLDITPNLKGKATLGSDGNSGIGIFFEKDY